MITANPFMNRRHGFLLLSLLISGLLPAGVQAQSPVTKESEPVIKPEIDRREITVPRLRAHDIEFGAYVGILNVESFGSSPVYGARLGYHVTEDIFIEAAYARSEVSDESFRNLGIPIFPEEQTELTYYNLSAALNIFPGEVFFARTRARPAYIYLIGGVGLTAYDRLNNLTFNFGLGVRVLPFDRVSVRVELRDHLFESDLLGENKLTSNLELSVGLSYNF